MSEHRLWGIYNANTGATLNALSILLSVPFIFKNCVTKKGLKVVYIVNDVFQFFCLVLTGSRAPFYALVIVGVILAAFFAFKSGAKSRLRIYGKAALSGVLVAIILLVGSDVSKYFLSYVPTLAENSNVAKAISSALASSNPDAFESLDVEYPDSDGRYDLTRVEEIEDRNEGFFNGRSDLWQAGLKAFTKSPIFGVGRENIYEKAVGNLKESRWAVNLSVGGLHNIYVTILVSSGIVGFLLMAFVAVKAALSVIKYLIKSAAAGVLMPCAAVTVLYFYITEFVEARILYQVTIFNVVFWLIFGFAYAFSAVSYSEAAVK
jgi:O-antigen ligase